MAEVATVDTNPMAEAPKTEKKQKKAETGTIKYVVLANCLFDNVFRKKGEVLELPASEKVTHSAVAPLTAENQPAKKPPIEMGKDPYFDPISEKIKSSSLAKALEGIPIRR